MFEIKYKNLTFMGHKNDLYGPEILIIVSYFIWLEFYYQSCYISHLIVVEKCLFEAHILYSIILE